MDPTGGLCQQGIVTAQNLGLFDAGGLALATVKRRRARREQA
jgi:hypothetical protein